jgi:uroporphyrinogen decarboxylase
MNSHERINCVLQGKRADCIPTGELCIDDRLVADHCGAGDVGFSQRLDFVTDLGLDLICLYTEIIDGSPGSNSMPLPESVQWNDLNRWTAETDQFVFIMLDGCLSLASRILGFQAFLTDLYRRPDEVADLMNQAAEFNLELARRAAGQGASGILIADDIAHTKGLMMSPEMLRQFFFPLLDKQVQGIKNLGLPVFFHSDGNLNSIMNDLVDTGLNGLQCLESAADMNMEAIKREYGRRLFLWGNLDPACLTGPLNEKDIKHRVAGIKRVADQGGVIFGTSSGLFHGMSLENLRYAYQCLNDSG